MADESPGDFSAFFTISVLFGTVEEFSWRVLPLSATGGVGANHRSTVSAWMCLSGFSSTTLSANAIVYDVATVAIV